jgi:hypothetical protein
MPLARYFLYVGGALLMLMFVADFCLPKLPVPEPTNTDLPAIRIHSDQKWPDRVAYDTSHPIITPAQPAKTEINVSASTAVADASAKARGAFAQLQSSETSHPQLSDPGKRLPKLQRQHVARRHANACTLDIAATAIRLVWPADLVSGTAVIGALSDDIRLHLLRLPITHHEKWQLAAPPSDGR